MRIIAIEEHFMTQKHANYVQSVTGIQRDQSVNPANPGVGRKLFDFESIRLQEMDEGGVDMQVLQLTLPGVETLEPEHGTIASRSVNDEIAEIVKKNPARFAGFAVIAPHDPEAAAAELERAITKLGMHGMMLNSNIKGHYLDEPQFRPVLRMAAKLHAPIYIHPSQPPANMIGPYQTYPSLMRAMWGFAAEVGLHAMRLIFSGVFDELPDLKFILGHMGESLPYWLWRFDKQWQHEQHRPGVGKLAHNPSYYVKENFYMTTSGMFWPPVITFACQVLGTEHVLFAVDYPFEASKDGVRAVKECPLPDSEKEKIFHLNTEKLLNL